MYSNITHHVVLEKSTYDKLMAECKALKEENEKLQDSLSRYYQKDLINMVKLDEKCDTCPAFEKEKKNHEVALNNQKQTYKAELKREREAYKELNERYLGLKLTYETMLRAHESMIKVLAKQLAKEEEEE